MTRPSDPELLEIQAATIRRQGERIRDLIRDRNAALSREEAALDLAEQYARRLGVNIGRDDVLKYVEQYWALRGDFERQWTELESFRWSVFQIKRQLDEAATNGAVDSVTARALAVSLAASIGALGSGAQKRPVELFARPAAPTQAALFGGAA